MIRRTGVLSERDPRAVKWSLIAGGLALSVGLVVEAIQTRQQVTREDTRVEATVAASTDTAN